MSQCILCFNLREARLTLPQIEARFGVESNGWANKKKDYNGMVELFYCKRGCLRREYYTSRNLLKKLKVKNCKKFENDE